jgi:molybdopterin synthase sulfur carrier subunit
VFYPCPVTVDDQVTVRFYAGARAASGCDQVTVAPGSLEKVIEDLHSVFPALTRVTPLCSYLVDGVTAKRRDDGPFIGAGSRVDVLPPFAGG